jgi:hypothetical protein
MLGDHSDDKPALIFSDTELVDVLDEPPAIAAVVVAVVFRGNFAVFPAQVEHGDQASSAKQRCLRGGFRQARIQQQQP